jgi:putative transposase
MPRQPRVFVEGAVFHVYNRLARGADVFAAEDEAERFVDLLQRACTRDGVVVLAWCVMSNHYHLAVRSGPVPLARTIGSAQARFGLGYNRRCRSSGPLWQSRYKAKLVRDERQLLQLVSYIHLNAVAAGLVTDPAAYPFSGHRELLGTEPRRLVDAEAALSLFGTTARAARRSYLATLRCERAADWLAAEPGRLPWWQAEPDRPVVAAVPLLDPLGRSAGLDRPRVSAEVFLQRAGQRLGADPERLRGPGQDRDVSVQRYLIAALAVERWRVRTKALADALDRRADVVTRWCRLGAELRQHDGLFRQRYEDLDRALIGDLAADR